MSGKIRKAIRSRWFYLGILMGSVLYFIIGSILYG